MKAIEIKQTGYYNQIVETKSILLNKGEVLLLADAQTKAGFYLVYTKHGYAWVETENAKLAS